MSSHTCQGYEDPKDCEACRPTDDAPRERALEHWITVEIPRGAVGVGYLRECVLSAYAAGAAEARKNKCTDCGTQLNDGEAKTFTVCDQCWDKNLIPAEARKEPTFTLEEMRAARAHERRPLIEALRRIASEASSEYIRAIAAKALRAAGEGEK